MAPARRVVGYRPGLHFSRAAVWVTALGIGMQPAVASNACRAIAEPMARLACYDSLADESVSEQGRATATSTERSAPALASATDQASTHDPTVVTEASATTRVENSAAAFGSESLRRNSPAGPASIRSRLVAGLQEVHKGSEFQLENGQVWVSVDDRSYESFVVDQPIVEVKKSALGTYWMKFEAEHLALRVRRVR